MSEVACVFQPFVDEVRARGIAAEQLLHGLPVQLEDLGNPRRRISWDDFTEIARRSTKLLGPGAFGEIAARSAQNALPAPLRWMLVGRWRDVRRLYRVAPRWGSRVFRATRAESELLEDGRVRQVVEILPEYRESLEFFEGVAALLRAAPRMFGEPDANVELVCDGRRGEFLIEPQWGPERDTLRRRLVRLGSRARRKGTVERFVGRLARTRDWREMPRAAARLLLNELEVRGAALSLGEPAHHMRHVVGGAGDRGGRPATVRRLHFARRPIGSLVLWTHEGGALGERAERRLHALRPLLALLLETAEVDAANRELVELLERNLSDWRRVEAHLERIAGQGEDADPLLVSAIPPSAGTVLLIEDDELLRRRVQREIEAQGHAVVGVGSDAASLPVADPASGPIGLVVADLETADTLPRQLGGIVKNREALRGILLVNLRSR
ncbi:MAG: hypothetical protein ABFS41_13300 [Myxococcota bacterium]